MRSRGSSATAQEQGLANLEAITWNDFFLPKGTPAAIVNKLNAAVVDAMESPAVKERMQELGVDLVAPERRMAQYLQTFVENEIAKCAGPDQGCQHQHGLIGEACTSSNH